MMEINRSKTQYWFRETITDSPVEIIVDEETGDILVSCNNDYWCSIDEKIKMYEQIIEGIKKVRIIREQEQNK